MRPIEFEFEFERTVRAPVEQVSARLLDIEGYHEWMAGAGSMLARTRLTSPRRTRRRLDVRRPDQPGRPAR